MDPFQLTGDAILDIDAIWLYLREREDAETADRIVLQNFLYLVIYQSDSEPARSSGYITEKRNVARILRQRL